MCAKADIKDVKIDATNPPPFFLPPLPPQKNPYISEKKSATFNQRRYPSLPTMLCIVKGVLHLLPSKAPKLACFVLYLKIINIFLKNNICIL